MKKAKANWGRVILPITFFVAVSIALVVPFMRSTAANPTLTNADFETGPFEMCCPTGTVTGWTVTGHAASIAEGATSGTHSAALSAGGDTTGDSIAQSFTTTSGTSYTVNFDSGIFGKRTGAALQVNVQIIGSGTLVNQTITPPDAGTYTASAVTFQHFQIPFTANSSSTTLKFTSVGTGNANADQLIDTVSVVEGSSTSTTCNAVGARADACYQLRPAPCTSGQAFWFPNADCNIPEGNDCLNPGSDPSSGTDGFKYIFTAGPFNTTETSGTFTENSNGTATLTGHLESTLHPGFGFDVNVAWSGFTTNPNTAGCNGPLLELLASCYTAHGGPVNPATWHFYSSVTGATLTGTGVYAGAIIQLTPVMHCFQVGNGASGKNISAGASGWFSWTVLHQPNDFPTHCLRNASQVNRTADFNFNCPPPRPNCTGQIGDFVWQDNNANGCQDANEPGIPNVTVQLFAGCPAAGNPIDSKTTDQTGHYLFTGLCAGSYTVRFTTPSGFTHTGANVNCSPGGDTTDSDCACTGTTSPCDVCVTLPADNSTDLTIDCGYIPPCTGTIGDFVWQDTNGNGCQDTNEPGIPNVRVDLLSGCGSNLTFLQTTNTDQTGHYQFTGLCAGSYTVRFTTPTGFTHTVANAGCAINGTPSDERDSDCACPGTVSPCDVCVTLPTNSSTDNSIDCGYIPQCTGTIGDFVWQDNNQNGCQDTNEPGIPNVRVDLLSGCGSNLTFLQTTNTDQTGHYQFTGLCAGSYTVRFTTPTGFTHTVANAGCNVGGQPADATDSDCACSGTTTPCDVCVTLPTNSSTDLTIDCGYIPPCTGTIGDFVWQDTNQNGCQDTNEPGIANVKVDLLSGCGSNLVFLQTTNTDQTGHYQFTGLCAGSYTVRFTTPTGFTHTVANAGCNVGGQPADATDSDCACTGTSSPCDVCVTLPTNSSTDLTIDCGYIPPPGCPPCVNPNIGLGIGAIGTVFEIGTGTVSVTGPAGGIIGDVLIGPKAKLQMSGDEFVTGTIKLGPGATFSNSAHFTPTVQTNVDLSAQIAAVKNFSTSAGAMACDQTFTKVDGSTVTTINATKAGVNVICIKDVSISGKQVCITNTSNFANVTFILNVTGQFALTGGGAGPQIRACGSVKPADIVYNLIGSNSMQVAFSGGGGGTNCCAAIVDGTLIAVNRDIALSPGLVNGEVIGGKNINIVSGSAVKCPTCP